MAMRVWRCALAVRVAAVVGVVLLSYAAPVHAQFEPEEVAFALRGELDLEEVPELPECKLAQVGSCAAAGDLGPSGTSGAR